MPGPFDLERFAPNPYFEFRLRNETFRCLADPDVDQVARMLRIEQTIQTPGSEMADAMVEGKQLLIELIQDATPDADLSEFKIGGQQLLAIFAGIMYGESVAQAVMEGIAAETPDAAPEDGSGAPGGLQHDDRARYAEGEGVDDDAAPLPLAKPSPEQSSISDDRAGTRQVIGTG